MTRLRVLHGHPLDAFVDRFTRNTEQADELWVASAFVDSPSVNVLAAVRPDRCSVRFLTGTYGRATRIRTFRALARLAKADSFSARIWDCGAHGQLHAKLYIWRQRERAVAWIGSANFTQTGLREHGELVAELRGAWNAPEIRALRSAFEVEWSQPGNKPLNERFLQGYHEAPRVPPELKGARRRPGRRRMEQPHKARVMWVPRDMSDRVVKQVEEALGPVRRDWTGSWLLWGRNGMAVRPGDKIVVARSKTKYALAEARQPVPYGGRQVAIPYEPLRGCAELSMNAALRRDWVDAGVLGEGKQWHRSRPLSQADWGSIVRLARNRK
ncbi:MAG: phospholipase D family protein [Myxococcales bacterium]|nr:phospholipase D family protein [Myxococcales bacterium]